MSCWCAAGDSMTKKLKLVQRSYKLITDQSFSFVRFSSSFDCHNPSNQFRQSNRFQVAPVRQTLLFGNSVNVRRNFTTTKAVLRAQRTNQDKEKMKNYIFAGAIALLVCFCFYMHFTMEHHQDYIKLDYEEEKK